MSWRRVERRRGVKGVRKNMVMTFKLVLQNDSIDDLQCLYTAF